MIITTTKQSREKLQLSTKTFPQTGVALTII